MIRKDIFVGYNSTISLPTLYVGDEVYFELKGNDEYINSLPKAIYNLYTVDGGVLVGNLMVRDGRMILPVNRLNKAGEYNCKIWLKDERGQTQVFYCELVLKVKELIGDI